MTEFLHSTEFYVILLTVAAFIVGLIAKPHDKGQAETSFAKATLSYDSDNTPRLEFQCLDNGDIVLHRCGLCGLTSSATVALAITRIGFDLSVEERITPGNNSDTPANRATFLIENLASERYHLAYNSSAYSTFLSTTLINKPGIAFSRNFPS